MKLNLFPCKSRIACLDLFSAVGDMVTSSGSVDSSWILVSFNSLCTSMSPSSSFYSSTSSFPAQSMVSYLADKRVGSIQQHISECQQLVYIIWHVCDRQSEAVHVSVDGLSICVCTRISEHVRAYLQLYCSLKKKCVCMCFFMCAHPHVIATMSKPL